MTSKFNSISLAAVIRMKGGQGQTRESCWEPVARTKVRDDGDLDQGSNSEDTEEFPCLF